LGRHDESLKGIGIACAEEEGIKRINFMKADLPQKIKCSASADGVGIKGILIEARFGVSCKNVYTMIIGPTDNEGFVEITHQKIIEDANKQLDLALMDYQAIEDVFTGVVVLNIMTKGELQRAIDAYELFKNYYTYRSNYEENLHQAIKLLNEVKNNTLKGTSNNLIFEVQNFK
jgi:hypothetical protein